MSGVYFNEDPNHFVYSRARAGMKEVSEEYARGFINQYKGSGITDFFICVGASTPWYKSTLIKSIIDKYDLWLEQGKIPPFDDIKDDVLKCVVASVLIYKNFYEKHGVNLQQIWIDELREIGIKPCISIRMNDIHNGADEGAFLHSEFFDAHPEYRRAAHRGCVGYFDYALDFTHKEVCAHYADVVRDALETFDADGIEFDWMREIYSGGIGKEEKAIKALTEFQGELDTIVKEYEIKRGHKIKKYVRMPHSIEKALRLGFDIIDWVNRGYVDSITVTPRWSSIDNNLPIDVWKRVLAGKNVEINAGFEILIDSYRRNGRIYENNTYETACGSACAFLGMDADNLYLFNYMDWLEYVEKMKILSDPEIYHKFLTIVGNPEKLIYEDRRHVCTFCDVYAAGSDMKNMLPFTVKGNNGKTGDYDEVRIPTGKIPQGAKIKVILGIIRPFEGKTDDINVYVNTQKARFVGPVPCPESAFGGFDYYEYSLSDTDNFGNVATIEVGIADKEVSVGWAEIDVSSK